MNITPKKENENVGFHYTVADAQLVERRKMIVDEMVNWVESNAKFIYATQSPEERGGMIRAKNFKW